MTLKTKTYILSSDIRVALPDTVDPQTLFNDSGPESPVRLMYEMLEMALHDAGGEWKPGFSGFNLKTAQEFIQYSKAIGKAVGDEEEYVALFEKAFGSLGPLNSNIFAELNKELSELKVENAALRAQLDNLEFRAKLDAEFDAAYEEEE